VRGALVPLVLLVLAGVAACGDASTSKIAPKGGSTNTSGDDGDAPTRSGDILDEQNGGGTSSGEPTPTTPTPGDDDGDGVPNADDCDATSKTLRRRIVEDSLSTDTGLFAAPTGFPTASWSFDGAASAYRQTRLLDGVDVSAYAKDSALTDVQIDVTAASTEVSSAFTPRLRQIFVLVGAVASGGSFSGIGCGIEVVQGETPEQRTTIVKLTGSAASVVSTAVQRVSRPAVQINEEFMVKVRFEDGAMICDVTQPKAPGGAITTQATASNLGALKGSVALYTRQTKALFKNIRVCALK
jgi:hypothetical protein